MWEQQLQQTQKAWKALRSKLDGVITAAQQQQKQQAYEQEQAAASPIGVRGLAASRAQGRQVGLIQAIRCSIVVAAQNQDSGERSLQARTGLQWLESKSTATIMYSQCQNT